MNDASFYRALLQKAWEEFPAYPADRYQGRGIVLCAGGTSHLANAFVCLKFLRELTDLPIELFYAGSREMPAAVAKVLREDFAPIALRDITEAQSQEGYPFLATDHFRGCQIKPFALLYSSFAEIFYIDADNIPLQSPETLFGWEEYRRTGALFWPDLDSLHLTTETLFRVFAVPETLWGKSEFESGQLCLDKRRCWKALLATCLANSDDEGFRTFCYRHTLGDKDTFRLAFAFAEQPYHLIGHPPLRVGNRFLLVSVPCTDLVIKIQHDLGSFYGTGMLQYDQEGNPLFIHKTVCEWNPYLDFRNLRYLEEGQGADKKLIALPLLADREKRGYRYLQAFRERCLPAFGRNRLKVFQGALAKGIVKALDGIQRLKREAKA